MTPEELKNILSFIAVLLATILMNLLFIGTDIRKIIQSIKPKDEDTQDV